MLVAERLQYFREDLELLANRYFDSRRILAGVGIGYSYLPRVKYTGRASIDVSDVLPEAPGGRDQIRYGNKFSDQGFASLIFTAKMRTALVDLSLQNLEESQTTQTPVFVRPFNTTEDLMGRSTIKTKLTSNYDVNLRFSIKEVINVFLETKHQNAIERGDKTVKELTPYKSRDDFEIGMGLTGFGIEDSVSTDFRRRANPGQTYSELTSFAVKESKTENNFNAVYVIAGYRIDLTDQASVAVNSRYYLNDAQRFDRARIDDFALTITATYYPLF